MYSKIANAQAILRNLHKKQAMAVPIAIGAGLAAGAHITRKGLTKAKEYQTGFNPGFNPNGSQG